jgi:HAAS
MAMLSGDEQQRIETYLARLRSRLGGINENDVREIVDELRSHILDKATVNGEVTAAGVDGTLAALGSPKQLANEYMTDNLLAQAEVSGSPVRILRSLFRWASLSVAGFFVLVGSILGYFLGAAFLLCALLKPFHPQTAGLWMIPDGPDSWEWSLRLGFGGAAAGGREVLGWWIVPIGLIVGAGLVMLTTGFALWCVRHYRKSRALPPG